MELADGVEYSFKNNNNKKQIKSYMIYNESIFDYSNASDEEKEKLKISYIIKSMEDNKATCKFIGTSRKKLGIK